MEISNEEFKNAEDLSQLIESFSDLKVTSSNVAVAVLIEAKGEVEDNLVLDEEQRKTRDLQAAVRKGLEEGFVIVSVGKRAREEDRMEVGNIAHLPDNVVRSGQYHPIQRGNTIALVVDRNYIPCFFGE